jgi:hypothetical protein
MRHGISPSARRLAGIAPSEKHCCDSQQGAGH